MSRGQVCVAVVGDLHQCVELPASFDLVMSLCEPSVAKACGEPLAEEVCMAYVLARATAVGLSIFPDAMWPPVNATRELDTNAKAAAESGQAFVFINAEFKKQAELPVSRLAAMSCVFARFLPSYCAEFIPVLDDSWEKWEQKPSGKGRKVCRSSVCLCALFVRECLAEQLAA